MACDCIRSMPLRLIKHLNENVKEHKTKPVIEVSFKDVVFPIDTKNGELSSVLKTDIYLKIEGRKTPKKTTLGFSYCPFCGKEYRED